MSSPAAEPSADAVPPAATGAAAPPPPPSPLAFAEAAAAAAAAAAAGAAATQAAAAQQDLPSTPRPAEPGQGAQTPTRTSEEPRATEPPHGAQSPTRMSDAALDPAQWAEPPGQPQVLVQLLQKLVENQVNMGGAVSPKAHSRGKKLASISFPEFHGGNCTVKQYREWKEVIKTYELMYEMEPQEVAMKIWLACRGQAKQALEFIKAEDLQRPDALKIIYQVLDS